jgi:ligand-binding sensor domain-containing protein/signal transduction histidine kinase
METILTPTQAQAVPSTPPPQEIEDQFPIPGVNSTLRFEHLGLADGLSQSVIHTIVQDRLGFLWVGTEDGLNRYDGYEFKTYRPDPENSDTINDRWITALAEDEEGYLWIGTRLGGLNRYNPNTDTFRHYLNDPEDPDSLSNNHINTIFIDSTDHLWIGTEYGLNRFENRTGSFQHFLHDPDNDDSISDNNITAIFEDSQGILWIGTENGGLNRFDPATFVFQSYKQVARDDSSLSNNHVTAIAEDNDGFLWVATYFGLNRLEIANETFTRYMHGGANQATVSSNNIQALHLDRLGYLWVGTANGLNRLDVESHTFVRYQHNPGDSSSLSTDSVLTIYEDKGQVLWIGTYGGGLNKYNRAQSKFTYYHFEPNNQNSLSANIIFPIYVDNLGIVWIGTYDGGLNRFNPRIGQFTHFQHDPSDPDSLISNEVYSIYKDSTGTLWVGTALGLSRLDPGHTKFINYQSDNQDETSLAGHPVYTIFEDHLGYLWFGTENGLSLFEPTTETFLSFKHEPGNPTSLSSSNITTLFEDKDRILWVGTFDKGLNRLDVESDSFTHYQYDPDDPTSISNNSIMSLYQDSQERLWIATAGGGLNRYDPQSNSFTRYTEKNGLPNNVVVGILEDNEGYLWLSTNFGLSRFDPETESFRNYTASDGLQSNEFNQYAFAKSFNDTMYLGGVNGLTVFKPSDVTDSAYLPPVVLTSFVQEGKPASEQPKSELLNDVTLAWPNNNFSFEFASLSYAQPERNQYAYMLENFDRDWNYISNNREGRYTNLPGGTYVLRLRGSNQDGVWNESTQTVTITVVPPFWNTWTFRILLLFSILAFVFVVYRLRVRSIQIQNLQLEYLVRERTSALQKRTEELEALYSGDERIIRALTLDQVFRAIVEVAVKMLHADRGIVFVWDEKQSSVVPRVSHGFMPETLQVLRYDKGEGMVGRVLETGETIIVPDIQLRALRPDIRAAIVAEGIHSLVHLPIKVNNQTIGVFNVSFTRPDAITEDTARLFTALVQRAALSVENMQLFEQTKELAVVEERNRVARDLHDSAKQKAFAALAQLGAVNGILKKDPANVWSHLMEAENLVYEVIQELTFLIQEMYPMALKEKGLATTLREYVFEWENRNGVMINLDIKKPRRLDLEMEQAIYRMIQEALANVARHSQSDQVEVSLKYDDECVAVTVEDNGRGFDVKRKSGGMGLRIIEERAESIGGQARVESKLGVGTKIVITAPLNGHS